jgi:small nuclear ribonucleoprotein (snRNP)-like protein
LKKLAESKKETAKLEPQGNLIVNFLGKKVSVRLLDESTVRGELIRAPNTSSS